MAPACGFHLFTISIHFLQGHISHWNKINNIKTYRRWVPFTKCHCWFFISIFLHAYWKKSHVMYRYRKFIFSGGEGMNNKIHKYAYKISSYVYYNVFDRNIRRFPLGLDFFPLILKNPFIFLVNVCQFIYLNSDIYINLFSDYLKSLEECINPFLGYSTALCKLAIRFLLLTLCFSFLYGLWSVGCNPSIAVKMVVMCAMVNFQYLF